MSSRRMSKRKLPCGDDGPQMKGKKALLCDCEDTTILLTEAASNGDIMFVADILSNKNLRLSKPSVNAAFLEAVKGGKKRVIQLFLNYGVCVKGANSSSLVAAAERGYLDIVKMLIDNGVSVNEKNLAGKTALMMAVEKSRCSALVQYLHNECDADVNLQDNEGKTVLMKAVELWDYETVQYLMSLGEKCDENIKDIDGHTAIDLAERNGFSGLLNVLRESFKRTTSPLNLAIESDNAGLVRQLLEIHWPGIRGFGSGVSPLAEAMHGLRAQWDGEIHCSLEIMDLLLQTNVDVDECHACGFTPLMLAAKAGSEPAVQKLLKHGADVNRCGVKNQTALMMAARMGRVNIVEELIEAGGDLGMKDEDDKNVLLTALIGGRQSCIWIVLTHMDSLSFSDIEALGESRKLNVLLHVRERWKQLLKDPTVLHRVFCRAIQARSERLVTALLDYGVDVNMSDSCGDSQPPLFLALGHPEIFRLLLDKGVDVNARRSPNGRTALMEAACAEDTWSMKTLLDYNADMYVESEGFTVLTLAITNRKMKAIALLLLSEIDVNHVTRAGETALLCAQSTKDFDMTSALIEEGANINFINPRGITVLNRAIGKNRSPEFLDKLIRKGADVNAQDANGETALFHVLKDTNAPSPAKIEKIRVLLQHGADVNHFNSNSSTPLMATVLFCDAKVLKVLLSSQVNVNAQDIFGNTAVHMAVQHYDRFERAKLKMLVSKGADLNIVNRESRTPLMAAFKENDNDAIKALLKFGASVNFQSSQGMRQVWQTDLDESLRRINAHDHDSDSEPDNFEYRTSMACLQALLEAGCSLHAAQASNLSVFFRTCIQDYYKENVLQLVRSGIGPDLLSLRNLPESFPSHFIKEEWTVTIENCSYVSPLGLAISFREIVSMFVFVQACFFHETDIKLLQHPSMLRSLEMMFNYRVCKYKLQCLAIEELHPKNWSLRTWSKLAVSRAVGFGEGREQRVRALPMPQGLQDELLCKNIPDVEELDKDEVNSSYDSSESDSDEEMS